MRYTDAEREAMRRTARKSGAVGNRAVVPQVAHKIALNETGFDRVLDYGCGHGQHVEAGRALGLCVAGYDLSNAAWVDSTVLQPGGYDVCYASNVLNVQPDLERVGLLLTELCGYVRPGGYVVVNLPASPIKFGLSGRAAVDAVDSMLRCQFSFVNWNSAKRVWICKRWQAGTIPA